MNILPDDRMINVDFFTYPDFIYADLPVPEKKYCTLRSSKA